VFLARPARGFFPARQKTEKKVHGPLLHVYQSPQTLHFTGVTRTTLGYLKSRTEGGLQLMNCLLLFTVVRNSGDRKHNCFSSHFSTRAPGVRGDCLLIGDRGTGGGHW